MSEQRKAAINAAYDIAASVAEGNQDAEALRLVSAGLDTARQLAVGELTGDGIDDQLAERVVELFGEVDPEHGPAWKWALQQRVAEAVLSYLGDTAALALVRKVRWADATDPIEPWDGGSPGTNPSLPAPSDPLPPILGVAYPDTPQTPTEAREGVWDNTEHVGDPAAEADDDSTDDPEVEVVDAEIVEVEQVTSGQRRYRMPQGSYYSPANRPGFTRSLTQGRPSTVINTGSEHLGDQR